MSQEPAGAPAGAPASEEEEEQAQLPFVPDDAAIAAAMGCFDKQNPVCPIVGTPLSVLAAGAWQCTCGQPLNRSGLVGFSPWKSAFSTSPLLITSRFDAAKL